VLSRNKNWTTGVVFATILSLVVTGVVVNVGDAHLLQPTRLAEAIIRGSTGTDYRQELVIHWIASRQSSSMRRQVRVGNAILQLQKYEAVGLRDSVIAGRRYLTLYVNVLDSISDLGISGRSVSPLIDH
jgi:hypothetical protein